MKNYANKALKYRNTHAVENYLNPICCGKIIHFRGNTNITVKIRENFPIFAGEVTNAVKMRYHLAIFAGEITNAGKIR